MSRTIFVHNKSGHDQTFEVHGWNNNQNINVKPRSKYTINAPDGSSGAIIALHDGLEGEQAEITKKGFEGRVDLLRLRDDLVSLLTETGNDFIDLSNIMGAGGNLTVMQVGEPSTLKGDPDFMQNLDRAWSKISQENKNRLSNCVHTNRAGHVIRIDPIKNFPELEKFVRTFADGKTYIGIGAWAGSPGNPNDNGQSSAAHGNKDIIVTYNDGNALPDGLPHPSGTATYIIAAGDTLWSISQRLGFSVEQLTAANPGIDPKNLKVGQTIKLPRQQNSRIIMMSFAAVPPSTYTIAAGDTFWSIAKRFGLAVDQLIAANPGVDATNLKIGQNIRLKAQQPALNDDDDGSPGIILTNKSSKECTYYFYDNYWNGKGEAGANFDKPLKHISLSPQSTKFVALPTSFKGRVQRGTLIPATWAEFQIEASDDHAAHGDISVEQGNDGGAWIRSTDGRKDAAGFTGDIQTWGPPEAYQVRADGVRALASTMGNWIAGPNQAAIKAQQQRIGHVVYVTGGSGIPDVASRNRRLAVEFY